MTVTATLALKMSAKESISTVGVRSTNVPHTNLDKSIPLSATSTPAISAISEQTLGDASGTLDLTALPATLAASQSMTGLKLVALQINNRSASHVFSIAAGASNGYAIGGVALKCQPGGSVLHYFADALTDVDGTHKTLDYTFDAADEADIRLIFG